MATSPSQPRQALSLLDTTSIIVGIIIGSAIYRAAPAVAANGAGWAVSWVDGSTGGGRAAAVGTAAMLAVWLVGGLVALIGAMCYAELATAYPHAGGTYVYLSEALGRTVGFAFAWLEFWIVRPGNIGAVAFVLAAYAVQILPDAWRTFPRIELSVAALAVLALAVLNALGLKAGKTTQNVLTLCKVFGLGAVVATAFTLSSSPGNASPIAPAAGGSLILALILVMFAYGGWADMSFVAAEVRDPERNIFRSLLLGTGAVVAIYLAVNLAFVYALGIGGLAASSAAAADVVSLRFGPAGATAISLLVVISCLGAINGMLFTGARVYYALGTHHPTFRWLGTWDERGGVPLRSLVLQTAVTLGLVVGFGLRPDGFESIVIFTGPFYWVFIGLVGAALIVIRLRGATATTYRVPLFPLTPLVFLASSLAMAWAAIQYAASQAISQSGAVNPTWATGAAWAAGVLAIGAIVGAIDWRSRQRKASETGTP